MKYILIFILIISPYLCLKPATTKPEKSKSSEDSEETRSDQSGDSQTSDEAEQNSKVSDESNKNSTSKEIEETEPIQTNNLHNYLINLGNSIASRIQQADGRYGHMILKDLYKYYNALDDISTLLLHPDDGYYKDGKRLYKLIKDAGGPAHLKIPVDYKLLEKVYKWHDDHQTDDLREVFEESHSLWNQCISLAENKRQLYTDLKKGRIDEDQLSE